MLPPAEEKAFRHLFGHTEDMEGRSYTILHEIVLRLSQTSLEDVIRNSEVNVNARDSMGNTALNLASERGDLPNVKLLLLHGADPNIPGNSQKSPLMNAGKSGSAACIAILLKFGAIATYRTAYNHTALHYAAIHAKDRRCAELLIAAGVETVSHADNDGRTPLGFVSIHQNTEFAACLLENGAQIRSHKGPEVDPLVESLKANRHRLLELYCEYGFDANVTLPKGKTLLHVVAEYGDGKSMEILARNKIDGILMGQMDDEGNTALDLVRKRQDDPYLEECFLELLHSWLFDNELEESDPAAVWEEVDVAENKVQGMLLGSAIGVEEVADDDLECWEDALEAF